MSRVIEIDKTITISSLAQELELPSANLVAELLKHGVLITLNEKIDIDTATLLIEELELDIEFKEKQVAHNRPTQLHKKRKNPVYKARPPVVAIMGHVDHGKTSLLDKICGHSTVDTESGGITQHISAYQAEYNKRLLTLLDTPGHEAFASIREHGVVLTDLVIIVVAADDGVKPQTLEAIRFAQKAKSKMIIAVNKVDKDTNAAGLNKIKQQLADSKILPEDWGGELMVIPVSAKTGEGIDKLLEATLLVTDLEELKADAQGNAMGLVIEARMQTGMGPIAVVLVQEGVLNQSDYCVAGAAYGRVKLLKDFKDQTVKTANASMPVTVCGLKSLPGFGDEFHVVDTEKEAKRLATAYGQSLGTKSSGMTSSEILRLMQRRSSVNEYNLIVKTDVQGSLTSVLDSIKGIDTDEVSSRVVHSGVGPVSEGDVRLAKATGAVIYCFNTKPTTSINRMAVQQAVTVKVYKIIYELLDDVKGTLEGLLEPEITKSDIGVLSIKGVFKTTKTEIICGGELSKGKLALPAYANVRRGDKVIASDLPVSSIRKGATEVKEVSAGEMCGLQLESVAKLVLQENDVLEFYQSQVHQRKL